MRALLFVLLFSWVATPARAEVAAAAPGGFLLQAEAIVSTSPDRAWRALVRIQDWWSPAHTYSGDARRLRLNPRAGGCFCEAWGEEQSVEHARVVLVMEQERVRTLRLAGGLGPLQEMGASGILTFTLAPDDQGVKLTMTYRVTGDPNLNFNQLAPAVDNVLMEQFGRLVGFAEGRG